LKCININTVKNILEMKDTYILMLTAKGQEFDKQRGKDVGVDYYITKPFDLDDLLEKIVNVLGIEM
jgi:two-component system alkaline phosphatase synthesis response regulator PhoP